MTVFRTLDDMDLQGQVVLTRVDINVPVKGGAVTDTTRIQRIVPTIRDIKAKGGKPVLLAHFGRPNGKPVPEMSLRVTVPALEAALGQSVTFMEKPGRDAIDALSADAVILIENTRFTPMEEANDPRMAAFLASLGDIYCNDAFSAAHRAHASTEGVAHLLPSCAGRLMQEELSALQKALADPVRPLVAIVGGAKVSTKIDLLENLIRKVDALVIGGGMANTFLAARGIGVGKSLCEHDLTDTARRIMAASTENDCAIVLPEDGVYATEFAAHPDTVTDLVGLMPQDHMMLDAGPASADTIMQWIGEARTLVWNGPLGAFEIEPFDSATNVTARFAAKRTREEHLLSVAGGGDTVAALAHAGIAQDFSYVSTAGGAFLEWLEGKTLPGVAALRA